MPRTAAPSSHDTEALFFESAAGWSAWLKRQHAKSAGVWLRLAKKDAGIASLTYPEALELALCHGWIDAQKKGLDAQFWLQRFTPRGPRSIWSKINRDKALALIERGAMKPAGLKEVERAQADGRWAAAYEGQRNMAVPPDLQIALNANRKAKAFFATLDSANRYAVLFRVHQAKKAETRTRRIELFVAMLARHETLHAPRTKARSK